MNIDNFDATKQLDVYGMNPQNFEKLQKQLISDQFSDEDEGQIDRDEEVSGNVMPSSGRLAKDNINFYQTQTVLPVDDNGDHPISEFGSVREE